MKLTILIILMFFGQLKMESRPLVEITLNYQKTDRHFEENFKKRYSGKKYNYEGAVKTSKAKPHANSHSQADSFTEKNQSPSLNLSFTFQVLKWVAIIVLILAVGYLAQSLLQGGNNNLFYRNKHKVFPENQEINADNIEAIDIRALIAQAEGNGDYRMAIRYYYLLVLQLLSKHQLIKYQDDKTNADYLRALASHKFYGYFSQASYIYNYTWYGEFHLEIQQYEVAKKRFVQFIKAIGA